MLSLRNLAVKDAYHLDLLPSLIVAPDDEFSRVIQRFAQLPHARGIFIADEENHLVGVITRSDMLDWARAKLGSFVQISARDRDRAFRLVSLVNAFTAREVMHPDSGRAAVRPDDSLAKALRLMIDLDLIVLPVVDEENRIIEDLKLDEILAKIVEIGSEKTGAE